MEKGWKGPPFDVFELAEFLGFSVIPCDSVRDARLLPHGRDSYRIEYNPHRPQSRIRFSIAHEVSHTLFPDCRERVRHRTARHEIVGDEWQLEMLCNVGASELLMPAGSFPEIADAEISIDSFLSLRERFQVSTEAVLLRFLKLTRDQCAVFAASYHSEDATSMTLDYVRCANNWGNELTAGMLIPTESVATECSAIGFTAKGAETWIGSLGEMKVECVAIPAFPGNSNPRVVGLLLPESGSHNSLPSVMYLVGDAVIPRGKGTKVVAHVVNDATPNWGGGFARVVAKKWPAAQKDFVDWISSDRLNLSLGSVRAVSVDDDVIICSIIAQHGYGDSKTPRIRYHALEAGLGKLAELALQSNASVHVPRIGCGQAGGNWSVVAEMLDRHLCRRGIDVAVYDLAAERRKWVSSKGQRELF